MQLSMYKASVPVFTQGLTSAQAILEKAAAHAEARKIDPAALLQARLYPDMFPLLRQVQIACDFAKGASARLAKQEVPSWPDTETTFAQLGQRIGRTLEFIGGIDAALIDGSEDREISFNAGGTALSMKGLPYLLHYALANYWFHVTTAYAILRHNGLEIGKRNFIGRIPT